MSFKKKCQNDIEEHSLKPPYLFQSKGHANSEVFLCCFAFGELAQDSRQAFMSLN